MNLAIIKALAMVRISPLVSALLLLASPVWSFTVSRGIPLRPPLLGARYCGPQQVRSSTVQLQVALDVNVMDALPVTLYVAAIIGVCIMQSDYLNLPFNTSDKKKEAVAVDVVQIDEKAVIATEEEVIMKEQTDVILKKTDEAVDEVKVKTAKEVKEEKAVPTPEPVVAKKEVATTATVNKHAVSTPPPKTAASSPTVSKPPPPKTTAAATYTVSKPADAAAAKPVAATPAPAAAETITTPPPRFQVLRKTTVSPTEKSISDLKKSVASTLEGEREKGERLKKAALKREEEQKRAAAKLDRMEVPAVVTTKPAKPTGKATTAGGSSTTLPKKEIKLQKTTTAVAMASIQSDSTDASSGDDEVEISENTTKNTRGSRRRKVWRVVKKVVAPWRKWDNIK